MTAAPTAVAATDLDEAALARKAGWAYRRAAARCGLPPAAPGVFELQHLDAWHEHAWYARQVAEGGRLVASVPDLAGTILVTWHFPEYPLLLPLLGPQKPLVLIASPSAWLEAGADGAQLCSFRQPGGVVQVARAFRSGRPIIAMLDYCYDETASVVADFCGYPSRTPSGLFRLGHRFGYEIMVIEIDASGEPAAVDSFKPSADPCESAARVNRVLEQAIFRSPPRWLLWASVDRRWIGVDYADP